MSRPRSWSNGYEYEWCDRYPGLDDYVEPHGDSIKDRRSRSKTSSLAIPKTPKTTTNENLEILLMFLHEIACEASISSDFAAVGSQKSELGALKDALFSMLFKFFDNYRSSCRKIHDKFDLKLRKILSLKFLHQSISLVHR